MDEFLSEMDNVDHVVEIVTSTSKKRKSNSPTRPISDDIKKMIIDALENGTCNRKTAASVFDVSYRKVCQIYDQFLKTGIIETKDSDIKVQKKLSNDIVQFLFEVLSENCTYSVKKLQEMVKEKYSIDIGTSILTKEIRSSFHYNLKRVNKASPNNFPSSQAKDRKKYCDIFLRFLNSKRMMIYFDEAEFKVTVRQNCKRPLPGLKNNKEKTKTVMASMTQNELLLYKTYDESGTRLNTLEYLRQLFDLLLRRNITCAVIIMDGAMYECKDEITRAVEMAGHELVFLPTGSSFFNPVEKMFSQWDVLVRSRNPGHEKELDHCMDSFVGLVNSRQCQKYWDHAMYNISSCINGKLICIS